MNSLRIFNISNGHNSNGWRNGAKIYPLLRADH
jgi:hypothetical protein